MFYTKFLLNGAWEMAYSEDAYFSEKNPFSALLSEEDLVGTEPESASMPVVDHAVPGYWEDMTDAFLKTPFFGQLRINPEYGLQQYPIAGTPPDMALPNVVGNFFYRRSFVCQGITEPTAIHFEGVQNAASVWVNDVYLGRHEGYSTPFSFDIPAGVLHDGENIIVLSVSNHRLTGYADEPVSGLTSRAANECTGGITGDVELRVYHSPLRDAALFVADDCSKVTVCPQSTEPSAYGWTVSDGETVLKSGTAEGEFSFDTVGLERWTPETPKLYTLTLTCGDNATLTRRFGVRRLLADEAHLTLNGMPYLLRGACEHCYFPETIHPTHDLTYYRSVIQNLKKLGFNFIRFHTYIPAEEYMQAADELGMLLLVESPNNTTVAEWAQIVSFCRRHTSVVVYCCGNELLMDDPFIEHLNRCADIVHEQSDALFAPMSAMRGLEYYWFEPEQEAETLAEPFKHHPRRLKTVGGFSDVYCSYPSGVHSYSSLRGTPEEFDAIHGVYNKPRLSHEISIDGTYTDLSLKRRYEGLRVGKTDMFASLERHLAEKGVLHKAPLYFKNSSEWQRRIRKFCFEKLRRSTYVAGYDFLGPIDTHWHTFGYDVGMMNEFYELKPGETVRNVRMYNSATVLLNDLGKKTNFAAGETLQCSLLTSHYGTEALQNAQLTVRLFAADTMIAHEQVQIASVPNGAVTRLYDFSAVLPRVEEPCAMKLSVTLDAGTLYAENEWELYLFPTVQAKATDHLVVSDGMSEAELTELLKSGRDVLLLGCEPFVSLPTTFRIALAGRTSGNLATVIADHPALSGFPHEGFCGWQCAEMFEGGNAVCFESDAVPFHPIVEVVSTHKYVIRQTALFEFNVFNGRLLVCGFNFKEDDPAAVWLKARLIAYAESDAFAPQDTLDAEQFAALIHTPVKRAAANTNLAFNPNDKTAIRKKK